MLIPLAVFHRSSFLLCPVGAPGTAGPVSGLLISRTVRVARTPAHRTRVLDDLPVLRLIYVYSVLLKSFLQTFQSPFRNIQPVIVVLCLLLDVDGEEVYFFRL